MVEEIKEWASMEVEESEKKVEWTSIGLTKETKKELDKLISTVPFLNSYEQFFKYLNLGWMLHDHGVRVKNLFPEKEIVNLDEIRGD